VNPEYDFSEGTRGKFYRADVRLRLPIYLDAEVQQFVERIAEAKQSDVTTVVNELLRSDMRAAEIVR
jgi:hypothetical protein